MLTIGSTIDRYRIESRVGEGGMAVVYRARHLQLESVHAIKVLSVTGASVRQRLLREGKVQAILRHPNVIQVTDVLDVRGAPALVMEFVEGPSLDEWLSNHRPSLDEAVWVFRGIVRGVCAAHARGVVHRDLKPANVLLAPTSEGLIAKVTDFGLVKSLGGAGSTQTGMALGTPEYMSPEQIRDARSVDQRTDLWSLGCILYELLCGTRAFSGSDRRDVFERIVAGTFAPPRDFAQDLPEYLERLVLGLCEVDQTARLGDCRVVLEMLHPGGPASTIYPVPKSLAPPIDSGSPIQLTDEFTTPDEAPRTRVASARTGEPALMRAVFGKRNHRPSSRATAEFSTHRRGYSRNLWWMAVPVVLATLLGLLTLFVAGPSSPRAAPAPPTEGAAP